MNVLTVEEKDREEVEGEMEGSGKNSRSAMHAGLNRQRKICARVCARAWLSERPRCSYGGLGGNTRQNPIDKLRVVVDLQSFVAVTYET